MEFGVFTETIKTEVEKLCGRKYKVNIHEVLKNNGKVQTGLTFGKEGKAELSVRPLVYLAPFYCSCETGESSLEEAAKEIFDRALICMEPELFKPTVKELQEFDRIRDRICFRLVELESNRRLLEQVPFIPYCNLAIVFHVVLGQTEDGWMTTLIREDHRKLWKTDAQTLYRLAMENTPRLFPPMVCSMEEILGRFWTFGMGSNGYGDGMEGRDEELAELTEAMTWSRMTPMYVITNRAGKDGAAVMLYDGVLRGLSEKLKCDLVILPSSVNEVIVVPYDSTTPAEKYEEIVRAVNQTEVSPEEVLSDCVYRYRRAEDRVEVMEKVEIGSRKEGAGTGVPGRFVVQSAV